MGYESLFKNKDLLDSLNFGICILNKDLKVSYWSSWLASTTGISQDDIVNLNLEEKFPTINLKRLTRQIKAAKAIKTPTYYSTSEGYLFPVYLDEITNPMYKYMQQLITIYPIGDENILITIDDQTPLKEATKKLKEFTVFLEQKKKLYIDKLTSLPNRNSFLETIESKKNKKIALLNIDGFTEINDFYGFETGDKYLLFIAKKLEELVEKYNVTLFKLPSDEYALCSFESQELTNDIFILIIKDIVNKIQNLIYTDEENNKIAIFLSTGISFEDDNILKTADIALKYSKRKKKDVVVYDESINIEKQIEQKHKWLKKLKTAIETDNIKAYFQPIYNIKEKKIEKYETLVRLIDEDGEVVSPYFFLDIAKQARLYNHITATVINQAFEKFKDTEYEFSINISAEDIEHLPTVHLLLDKLKHNPETASRVVIELLEDEGIENFDTVNHFITEIKKHGAKIAIDDFGTGYSNFSYLLKLNVDYLKIDASLIENIHIDENSKKIVETLVDFSKKIGAKSIGEFVHNQDVLNEITNEDLDYAQGFFIDIPREEIGGEPRWKE